MKRALIPPNLENRILLGVLTCLLIISAVGSVIKIGIQWQIPLIYVALFVIIRLLIPVAEINMDVKSLRELSGSPKVSSFTDVAALYENLRHALSSAESTVDTTHIRDTAPSHIKGQSKGWFEATVEWSQGQPSRSLRRIISVRNQAMLEWANELRQLADSIPNFQIRVVDWNVDAPAINVILVDDSIVFIVITGEVFERTKGIAIEDKAVVNYFYQYYDKLWNSAQPVGEYLDSLPGGVTKPSRGPCT